MSVRGGTRARILLAVCVAAGAATLAPGARASQLIDRNASGLRLGVNQQGLALLTYRTNGALRHVVAWGAINALPPTPGRRQVKFQLDYAGGWGAFRRDIWKGFRDACQPYDGPPLSWIVTACKAPDGSYWAVQSWQKMLPNVGLTPSQWLQSAWEVHLSHWNTEVPVLTIDIDWAYRRYHHLYGSYTYLGQPIFGFRVTRTGAPLDTWARNIYVDTYNSAYGSGWKRENSFLSHNPTGTFCYGFYPGQNNSRRPAGTGTYYRATAIGPGVTPDPFWQSAAPGPYNRDLDLVANDAERNLFAGDRLCKAN
ncbi:MAG: hypothetical protein QOH73_242 [Gaiellaceae bacterium]|nr:hypothetical protein [Gaiellaceae bacterium]